jgi:nucleoside-diphosphate-sugar epimerase
MIFLVGGRGRLGRALAAAYPASNVIVLERSVYEGWSRSGASEQVARFFESRGAEGATILVTAGLLDPRLPREDLLAVNFELPKNIIEGACNLGARVASFGTVMEGLLAAQNPYVHSKTLLGDYVDGVASASCPAVHLRIHTLFGAGEPSPFMFLGQMLDALRRNSPFSMTSGSQLREYHHVQDDARAIRAITDSQSHGVLDVSHGQPVSLREIAVSVFQAFGKDDMLHIGGLPEPLEENYRQIFNRPAVLDDVDFRETLPAIVDYMKKLYREAA